MKATNNLNMDLKEEIENLNGEIGKLNIFKDDHDEMINDFKTNMEKELTLAIKDKDEQMKNTYEENKRMTIELEKMKSEHKIKMQSIKLMEIELQNKLEAHSSDAGDDDGGYEYPDPTDSEDNV